MDYGGFFFFVPESISIRYIVSHLIQTCTRSHSYLAGRVQSLSQKCLTVTQITDGFGVTLPYDGHSQ